MVAQVASSTDINTEYDVTVENGLAVHCGCMAHFYHPERACKHMISIDIEIELEIEKAERFLAVKLQVQGMEETWKANRDMAWDNRF
jgi:hypothetical protein